MTDSEQEDPADLVDVFYGKHIRPLGNLFILCGQAVNDAIGVCGRDLIATIRSLVVANNFLAAQNEALTAELDHAWRWISPGYTRSTSRRRMKTGEPG